MSQDHRSDDQHKTGPNTAALVRDFNIEVGNGQHDPVLRDRDSDCLEKNARRESRLVLQEVHDSVQRKCGDRHHPEQKAKWKKKRSESIDSKAEYHAADPPGYEGEHTE